MKSEIKYLIFHLTDVLMNSYFKKKKIRKPYVTRVNNIAVAIQYETVQHIMHVISVMGGINYKKG